MKKSSHSKELLPDDLDPNIPSWQKKKTHILKKTFHKLSITEEKLKVKHSGVLTVVFLRGFALVD